MSNPRTLNTATLDVAAQAWVGQWYLPTVWSKSKKGRAIGGRDWILQSFFNADFKDEFEYLYPRFLAELGPTAKKDFLAATGDVFTPRNDADFEAILAKKLAINPAGEHLKGKIGTGVVGQRLGGMHTIEVETKESLAYRRKNKLDKSHRKTMVKVVPHRIDIYEGEVAEHGHQNIADFIRDASGAFAMNIGNADAILALDALLDSVDAGAGAATIDIRSGTQPVDPDAAATGTRAAALVMTATAFNGAADQSDGTVDAAAASIADSTTETATQTAGYFVVGSTTTPPTLIDQHISGLVATSGADMNFNTVAFVSGATVSITSYVITMDQGTTAV